MHCVWSECCLKFFGVFCVVVRVFLVVVRVFLVVVRVFCVVVRVLFVVVWRVMCTLACYVSVVRVCLGCSV